jgi:hypothetical protein
VRHIEFAFAMELPVSDIANVAPAILELEVALAVADSLDHVALIYVTIRVGHLASTIGMVILKLSLKDITVFLGQLAFSLACVQMKLSLVHLVLLRIAIDVVLESSLAVELSIAELSLVEFAIRPLLDALARDFAIMELADVPGAISHDQRGWGLIGLLDTI